ncbi:MAG: hypothetical protein JRE58_03490 [Deltaproteobacteria bacterium]|nr:hypothetical protein [Deltaproteobacteria bacterium]
MVADAEGAADTEVTADTEVVADVDKESPGCTRSTESTPDRQKNNRNETAKWVITKSWGELLLIQILVETTACGY